MSEPRTEAGRRLWEALKPIKATAAILAIEDEAVKLERQRILRYIERNPQARWPTSEIVKIIGEMHA